MKTEKLLAVLIASAVLQTMIVSGQEDVFKVSFNGSVRPGETKAGAQLNNRGLIEQCVGTGFTANEIKQNFALVYNATADTIQVVNRADGSVVCDLFHFEGGTATVDHGKLVRLAFVFTHDQADSIGSAVITETPKKNSSSGKPQLNGKIQFTLPIPTDTAAASSGDTTNDVTNTEVATTPAGNFVQANALASAVTDQQVGTGKFVVGSAFVPGVPENKSSKKKNKNNNTNTSTETTTTDNTDTSTTDQSSSTNENTLTNTNSTQTSTNSLGTTNSLGGMNTSILSLFPGDLTTH